MFSIKRKGRTQAARLHKWIEDLTKSLTSKLSSGLRLKGRVRLMNRWGKKHPRKLMLYYSFFALSLLSINLLGLIVDNSNMSDGAGDPLKLNELSTDTPFGGMEKINYNREVIQQTLAEYAEANIQLAQRFDSLYNLPVKSRADSMEMMNTYRKLYNNPTNKPHESKEH